MKLNPDQIKALADWANADTTAFGPKFSAALSAARQIADAQTIAGPIVLHEAKDIPDQWIAHDLATDIQSQGDDPTHAFAMLAEAVALCKQADAEEGVGPRKPAPHDDWPESLRWLCTGPSPRDGER